jgi:hypothetical protein
VQLLSPGRDFRADPHGKLQLATERVVTACHGKSGYSLPRKEWLQFATERVVTACHGKTEKHIRGHKPRIVGGPEYLSRYSDSLRAGKSGDRIPVEAKFSFPVQSGPGVHPTLYTLGTGSFRGKVAGH